MSRPSPNLLVALFLAASVAGPVTAQPASETGSAREAAALRAEWEQLAEDLDRLQARALENAELSRRSELLVRDVEARMVALEPATTAQLAELEVLKGRMKSAREGEDREAFAEALERGRTLSRRLEATRSRVLEEEDFADRTRSLQEALVAEMTRLDPTVPEMLERLNRLDRDLRPQPEP